MNQSSRSEDKTILKSVKRMIKRPRKTAPEPETLRAWARSAAKARNKA
jgi:hypothetical protein